MKGRKIDKRPPQPTGETLQDIQKDLRAMADYLEYLRTEINFDFSIIYKDRGAEN